MQKNMEKIIGINPVLEILRSDKNIEKIEVYKGIKKDTIKEILNLASKRNIKIFYTDRRIENSQGVTALVSEFDYYMDLSDFLGKVLAKDKSIVVILDQIQDPRNFGAIIRSAECFGADGIVIQDRNNVKVTETVVKSSTGAIEHVDIVKVTNISDTIDRFKKYGYRVYGAEADGENFYYEEDYPDKVCLVLGSEGNGMRKKVKEHCDKIVKIHLKGHINSLNVSVAGGIILAEMAK
jgi:RNA methyltransferase, trmH family, group 3